MGKLTAKQLERYVSQPAFTDPAVSSNATRLSVPQDVWRSLEMVPALLTWSALIGSVILSFFAPAVIAYLILLFDVYWLMKSISMSHAIIRAYRYLKRDMSVDWQARIELIGRSADRYEQTLSRVIGRITGRRVGWKLGLWNAWQTVFNRPLQQNYREFRDELRELQYALTTPDGFINPHEIHHLVVVATYTEELDVLRPSFQAIADSAYDSKKLIVVLATEERDQDRARANAAVLKREFGRTFKKLIVTEHPADIVSETKGKGSNISWAGRIAVAEIDRMKIQRQNVIVTTLDADHRPHPQYFSALTYHYALSPERKHLSFQPTPLFHNNLWHTTAINRVIATGSSFFHMKEATQPYRLHNFAAHSQGLPAIIDTDFWSVDTIVEDGQQYWRTYFRYHGDHFVRPIYVPVYQDAVLADSYPATLKAQYLQLRRWAWGSSDFPYIVVNSWNDKSIPLGNKLAQIGRFLEGHWSWATAPILVTFVGWLPILLSGGFRESLFGQNLAPTASLVLTLAMVGIVVSILVSLLLLPPKPPGYKERHRIMHVLQWALTPVTTILFSSVPAIEAQTRLAFGKYLEFRVTEKHVKRPHLRDAVRSITKG
jgi:cellulose synthase/poly-beta-1,6-N-acetylglucosamine synthase-like glycosyltransferase